jgi:hypothetical protein
VVNKDSSRCPAFFGRGHSGLQRWATADFPGITCERLHSSRRCSARWRQRHRSRARKRRASCSVRYCSVQSTT